MYIERHTCVQALKALGKDIKIYGKIPTPKANFLNNLFTDLAGVAMIGV